MIMTSWRNFMQVHAAAELLPPLEPGQFVELVEDIQKNGLLNPVVFYKDDDGDEVLVDGRNRLDAMEQLSLLSTVDGEIAVQGYPDGAWKREDPRAKDDPFGYVIGANIRRRHLTADQKSELIQTIIKLDPSKSNRQIGEIVNSDHKTIGAARVALEGRG